MNKENERRVMVRNLKLEIMILKRSNVIDVENWVIMQINVQINDNK